MPVRKLPNLSPTQVVDLQDALLANADRLLTSALAVLDLGNVGLARSLAILAMEESGKAIAIHERRVEMAYAPEGEPFVNARLENLWASHQEKLDLVHRFLAEERYWFGTEPADPDRNLAYLGTIKRWTQRHDKLKQRGFYVDIDRAGGVLEPTGVSDRESLVDVIGHVHQIGWQLRLGEHIEAKQQAEEARGTPPPTEAEIEEMREMFSGIPGLVSNEEFYDSMRQGREGRRLNNDDYRLHLPEPGSNPFENLGKPGYEAETRELMRLVEELERRESQ
ncbi:AbiV family abortive infection protein [Micromonospora echinaurantiaca]|uniref:AbiV family abortive infection protein n=1 Tax=Micromonospora echinaurantiaca TaxID=47857 RepID=UPI00379073DF